MNSRKLLSILACIIFMLNLCGCSGDAETSTAEKSGFDYDYINAKGQHFSFHCSNADTSIYEKTVDELISEWTDNVALAEKTYNKSNVLVVTEGYIQNINKGSDDSSYYILLSANKESDLFSMESLRVYFEDESTLNALLSVKKGDYITLLCSAQDTTFFLEYPKLKAELVLEALEVVTANGGLSTMLGLTISDIVSQYGDSYSVESWSGGMYITYERCPYNFYYSTSTYDSDFAPSLTDEIWGVETFIPDTLVDGSIKIGSSLEDVEAFLGYKLELYDDYDYDGECSTAEIMLDGLEYKFTFDKSSNTLAVAGCWRDFDESSHSGG